MAGIRDGVGGEDTEKNKGIGDHPLRLGGNLVWGEYFGGLIDEVRVYNRALTAAQIQADMQAPL